MRTDNSYVDARNNHVQILPYYILTGTYPDDHKQKHRSFDIYNHLHTTIFEYKELERLLCDLYKSNEAAEQMINLRLLDEA